MRVHGFVCGIIMLSLIGMQQRLRAAENSPATAPEGWQVASPRDDIRPAFRFDQDGGPAGRGSFVIQADGRLDWIGASRGKGAYKRRVIEKTADGYALGEELPLLEASAGKPLAPPLHNSIEPTLRIVDWDGDGRADILSLRHPDDRLQLARGHRAARRIPRFTVGKPLRVGDARLRLFTFDDAACEPADLDGDGRDELFVCTFDRLLWCRRATGSNASWLESP